MRKYYLPVYAQYYLKFLQGYAAEGVPVQALTSQNEVDTGVTTPPQGNGPMFGRPCSSRARFHAVMERHQLFSTPLKVPPHLHQSVR
jgi:hypothetical protein